MRAPLVAPAVVCAWLALAAPGRAAAPAPADADEAAASALVEQAARAYDQNQLDQALRLLARAYQRSPRPSILYNQAQVLRTKNDCAAALDAYQRFISATAPDDPDRERAVHHRDEMQGCVDQRPAAKAPVQPVAAPPAPRPAAPLTPAPIEAAPPVDRPPPLLSPSPARAAPAGEVRHARARRIAGWALIGAGVVAAGAAAALGWQAHHLQGELNADLARDPRWTSGLQSLDDDGRRDAAAAWWCGAAAALTAGGGATLLMLSRPSPEAERAAASRPPPLRAIALFGWSGVF
jgi:tetratricopeptide (TPR) repeat protein